MTSTIPDGIYDNPRTMCRESWRDGEVTRSISMILIELKLEYGGLAGLVPRWGTYPPGPAPLSRSDP